MNFQFSIFPPKTDPPRADNSKFRILNLAFLLCIGFMFFPLLSANAATNILSNSSEHYAWNDIIGWINFYSTDNVNVASAQLSGYASSSVGYIALDCATSPNGDICSTSNFKVLNNGNGNLSGWAYNDIIGWISFDSVSASSSYFYQTVINPSTGEFSGWAYNDIIGWISFNCSNESSCGTSDYKVKTSWTATQLEANLISSIFDTGATSGVALNTIMWQGNQPSGTNVKFQISSNSSLAGGGIGGIDAVYHYAWNDSVGWIDFGYSAGAVNVGTSQLTGYAYNGNISEIALDCATSPAGNMCSTSNFKVNRDASGDLSGYAWNDYIGWISFNCSDSGVCGSSSYKVNISPLTGAFTGYAWNDYVGWISFNCSDPGICGSSNYRVNTAAQSSWNFRGPDGSDTTYYSPIGPGYPVQINLQYHNNVRYFRYKVFLYSNTARTLGPRVDDVIINYSP
ncbi:MAG: hypothetical protein WC461_02395 [Candidatus Paceibacterota bacterium]